MGAIRPKSTLSILTIVSILGAVVYLALVLFTESEMQPLYFGLIILMCAIGLASLYILRTSHKLAIVVYAWLAGICLVSLMAYDALRGERFDHLLWIYPVGVIYIIIHVSRRHAFLYSLGSSLVGVILGLCECRFFDCVFYALLPLAVYTIAISVADIISSLQAQTDDLVKLLETWERGG